jgi:hypothetical protein
MQFLRFLLNGTSSLCMRPVSLTQYEGARSARICSAAKTPLVLLKFIKALITDLNQNLISGRDTEPNFSRSAARPVMYTAMRAGAIEKALFVGGSNAESLSVSASALGLDSYKITKGGWKLTKENVDKIIPVIPGNPGWTAA